MSQAHEAYKRALVDHLQELHNDRELLKAGGFDGIMSQENLPDTPLGRDYGRKLLAERLANLDFKIANQRLSIALAETSEKHREEINRTLNAHRRAMLDRKAAEGYKTCPQ